MTEKEIYDKVIPLLQEYIRQLIARYTPNELTASAFELKYMRGYASDDKVEHTVIRQLVRLVANMSGGGGEVGLVQRLYYPDGSVMIEQGNSGVVLYDSTGSIVATYNETTDTLTIGENIRIDSGLELGAEATATITEIIEDSIGTTEDIDALWDSLI